MNNRFLQPSHIQLSKSALESNIQFLRERSNDSVKISSVIKGNAYGHGISTFLPMAEECGINHFSVFSADEANEAHIHRKKSETNVMIMGMIRDWEIEWAVENEIEFYLFEPARLDAAIEASKKVGKRARIHLQIETGMNRTGFEESEYKSCFKKVTENEKYLDLKGICTHYAGAESVANYYRIIHQDKQFRKVLELAGSYFNPMPTVHAASSAAYLIYPEMRYDMARIGIAMFGFWPSSETYMHTLKNDRRFVNDPLVRVLSWKSEIMSTKWVDEGEFIGYGNTFLTSSKMKIATVPIGYSHGFARSLTNAGYVLISGERARVVGLVNMNMITVEITDMPDAKKGDEVVIIGHQEDKDITVASFGEMSNNLNYEVLTRLPSSIPRDVVR
ncbi:MAG: alanine racemase [Balneolaceae bacterium]